MSYENYDPDESEQNVYGDSARENLMKDDEISPEEEAFMQGYEESEEEDQDEDDDYEKSFE